MLNSHWTASRSSNSRLIPRTNKTPVQDFSQQAVRRLALWAERNQKIVILPPFLFAALLQNANPLPIHNSLRSIKQIAVWRLKPSFPREFRRFRDFSFGQNLCISFRNSLLQEVIRLQLVNAPLIPTGEK